VKRSTAVRHLVEMAEVASERLALRHADFGWPLEELWVTGDLLGVADTVEAGSVELMLDVPPDEVPWMALHPAGEWIGRELRHGKRPMMWCYRPLVWPVWNHRNRRLTRFWSAHAGTDDAVIEALRSRRLDAVTVVEPSPRELGEQLREELVVSRRYLRVVLDRYWDFGWRRDNKGQDRSPEDALWRAAMAVSEIQDTLDDLDAEG